MKADEAELRAAERAQAPVPLYSNRAARRRADRLQRRASQDIETALAATRLEGASSPKAAMYRVARRIELKYGAESLRAKVVRARFAEANQRARHAELVKEAMEQNRTLKGRTLLLWQRFRAFLAGLSTFFARTQASDAAVLEAAGPRTLPVDTRKDGVRMPYRKPVKGAA